jgi:hypothetical protein
MTTNNLRLGGAVIFWSLAEYTDRERLADGLAEAGFGDLSPEPRPAAAALKDALESTFRGARVLVRPLANRDGFAVITEARGADFNRYEQTLAATLVGTRPAIQFAPYDTRCEDVLSAYERHRTLLKAHQVGECLVRIIERLGGTRLRPQGAIYWLPENRLELWQGATRAVELATAGRPHASYLLRHQMDADAVKAVRDAVCVEVLAEAKRIQADVLSGELKERALESRRAQAEELRGKVALYESLLDAGLAQLREAIDAADQAAAAAALLASALPAGKVA